MEFPTHAQAVIVGGGVGGASIAYHLTLMGWKDVVVIERHELTSGSTFHSAGLVGQLRTSSSLTQMMRYSTDLYRNLKKLTGVDPGWEEVGSLRIASSDERMVELKRVVGYSKAFGMPLDMLTAKGMPGPVPADVPGGCTRRRLPQDGWAGGSHRSDPRSCRRRQGSRRADPVEHACEPVSRSPTMKSRKS